MPNVRDEMTNNRAQGVEDERIDAEKCSGRVRSFRNWPIEKEGTREAKVDEITRL